jgi:hypothetical protein
MTSFRHRELGATLRQCCLTGQSATVVIDHKEYEVSTKQISGEPRGRFGVGLTAFTSVPKYRMWQDAKVEIRKNASSPLKFHIWDYSTTPPTDVTDADPDAKPEMVNWTMAWQIEDGFHRWESFDVDVRELATSTYRNGDLRYAKASRRFPAGHTPTIHDLNEALKPYNVQVPVPEEPRWWKHEEGVGYREVSGKGAYPMVALDRDGDNITTVFKSTLSDRHETCVRMYSGFEKLLKAGKKP